MTPSNTDKTPSADPGRSSPHVPSRAARIIGGVLAGTAAVVAAAIIVAWSGMYDVAASRGHWAAVQWFLEFGLRNSVAMRAGTVEAPPLDNPDLVRLGAAYFHRGCAYCHGAPGIPVNPIARDMLPSPPDLSASMRPWKERELFWIVEHGLKYTGMPGWVAPERKDEIWAVVAFLKRLPTLDARSYRDLALAGVRVTQHSGSELAISESNPEAISACARCHGAEDQLPMSDLVPVLHGQPADYLMSALQAYAEGKRRSGIMQPLAADLQPEDMRQLADYYAGLTVPHEEPKVTNPGMIESGRKLALEGAPDIGVLPCVACHANPNATYPRLDGQHAAYLAGHLRLWKMGNGPATDVAAVMAPIAQRLSEEQIDAVSAYFATLPPGLREAGLP